MGVNLFSIMRRMRFNSFGDSLCFSGLLYNEHYSKIVKWFTFENVDKLPAGKIYN